MQGYNFTERVRRALALAREEAALLHHEYVGTEHILLGIVREGEGVALAVLESMGLKRETVRNSVLEVVQKGAAAEQTGPDLPYTSRAKKVLELAMTEARELGHTYVGTEQLLLGLLREEKGIGAQVLVGLGVTLEKARASVLTILGPDPSARRSGETLGTALPAMAPLGSGASRSVRLLLTISAAFATVIGLALIFDPIHFEARMALVVDDRTATIAQAQGAILLGLGILNWLARGLRDRTALWAILYSNFVIQLVSLAVVARALVHGFIPMSGVGALVMHVLLGAGFGWELVKMKRAR